MTKAINFIAAMGLAVITVTMTAWFVNATLDGLDSSRATWAQEVGQ